jgi:endonuclease/exonuclease/phosphatase (EEP) superfamily protein YafD
MLVKRFFSLLWIIMALVLLWVALSSLVNTPIGLGYLLDIFTGPILFGTLASVFIFVQLRQRLTASICILASVLLSFSLWPQVFPHQSHADKSEKPIRIMFANLWVQNPSSDKILPWVKSQNPDVIAVVESGSEAHIKLIQSLKANYRYEVRRLDTIIFSRFPLVDPTPFPAGYSLLTVKLMAPNGQINLAVAHLTRPWPFTDHDDQAFQFSRLNSDLMRIGTNQMVLVGDFNTTASARLIQNFSQATHLNVVTAKTGTWPAVLPSPMRIAIDNVMIGNGLAPKRKMVGPYYGSDHRPILVDIYQAKQAKSKSP